MTKQSPHWIVSEPVPSKNDDGEQLRFRTASAAIKIATLHHGERVFVYKLSHVIKRPKKYHYNPQIIKC
jgi:hypothetical protein